MSSTLTITCPAFPEAAVQGVKQLKKNVLIIGAGGVAKVVAHKCAQHNDELGRIAIASRSISKCQAIIDSVQG